MQCKGSMGAAVRLALSDMQVGKRVGILRHPACECNTGCRRVAIWPSVPNITDQDWLLKAIAKVRFGDGCVGPEVEVDFKRGVILDLLGCHTEVDVEIVEFIQPEEPAPLLGHITYAALSSCCGAGAARGCATRTYARYAIGGDGVPPAVIPIPPFAYAVQFVSVAEASAPFFVDTTQLIQYSTIVTNPLIITDGSLLSDPWPIVNGAQFIRVSAGTEVAFEPVFLIGV